MNSLNIFARATPRLWCSLLHAMKCCKWGLAVLLLFLLTGSAFGQAEISNLDTATKPAVEKERTIYIPFSKLREVFEKEGRGVFLPYEQFQTLWNAAHDNQRLEPPSKSPIDAIITSAFNEASVERDVVQVSATLSIELIKKGWLQIPLRLKGAAIQSATVGGEVARITPTADGGYQLLIEHKSAESESIELQLVYARAFSKSPGRNSVAFDAPQAPVNRWRIRIPQAGVKVNVEPMIAATEVIDAEAQTEPTPDETGKPEVENPDSEKQSEKPAKPTKPKDETILLAFVGAAPQVAIDWTPKSEGALGMTALTAVQVQQEMYITEGAMRTRATIHYDISRAELTELSLEVPEDQKVVNVFDPNVRKWLVSQEGDVQRILVELFEPARTTQNLLLELEQFATGESKKVITVPRIRVADVGRQQGTLVVNIDPALRAESTVRTGLLQLDVSELPPQLAGQVWAFAYRYAALPFELSISVEKIQPRISVTQLVESYLEPELWSIDLLAIYNIEEAGIFQLEFAVPPGFDVLQVRGREAPDALPAAVDTFHLEGNEQERLIVNLARKAIGKVALSVHLQRRLSDPNLLTPTGSASTFSLNIPQAKQANMTRAEGRMILHAPESLRINPTLVTGLRPVSFSEIYQGLPSIRENRFPSTRPTLAFAYADQVAQLDLSVERRKSYVTARQRMVVRLDSGVVRYETMIFYEILYSGIKSLRIDVPTDFAADIRNTSSGIRETTMNPPPDDVADDYVAWSLSGETELIGNHVVRLAWERKLNQLEVGKSVTVAVPYIKPVAVDRAWGQIVLTKTESLDVLPSGEPIGLRPIDPGVDVMPDAQVPDAALAFEFYDNWSLSLVATRYQLEEVKRTSIERAVVRVVVTRSNQRGVQALYRLRSARQRLAIVLPADAEFEAQPARINGKPVALERGDQGQLFVPLSGQDPNTPFALELRYSVPGDHQRISIPEFPEDPAVQKVYAAVFLPNELALIGSQGPWTEEFTWKRQGIFKRVPQTKQSDEQLLSWVREGVPSPPPTAFQTDGTMALFSALKPEPSPQGELKLWAIGDKWLAALIVLPLALLSLVLLRSSLRLKLVVIAILVIAIIASGVFVPTFAQQLLNVPLFAGLAIVAVAWLAWYSTRGLSSIDWGRERVPAPPATVIAVDQSLASASQVDTSATNTDGGKQDA